MKLMLSSFLGACSGFAARPSRARQGGRSHTLLIVTKDNLDELRTKCGHLTRGKLRRT
jgi:chemotaxis receptor (MCP) glutamine deamidase CheD